MTNNVPYILWLSANERVERVFGDGFCSGFLDGALQNGPCLLFVAGDVFALTPVYASPVAMSRVS